jgi:hypothetical protein
LVLAALAQQARLETSVLAVQSDHNLMVYLSAVVAAVVAAVAVLDESLVLVVVETAAHQELDQPTMQQQALQAVSLWVLLAEAAAALAKQETLTETVTAATDSMRQHSVVKLLELRVMAAAVPVKVARLEMAAAALLKQQAEQTLVAAAVQVQPALTMALMAVPVSFS